MAELLDLEAVASMTEILALTVKRSGVAPKVLAGRLGIELCHFNRMMNPFDSRHFPTDKLPLLMRETASTLPLEWLAARMGYRLHEKSLGQLLEAMRDAMVAMGADVPKFSIHEHGRIEPAGRLA